MDVYCLSCGEPWDTYHLRHDLTPEEIQEEGWEFGRNRLVVKRCGCCPPKSESLKGPDPEKLALVDTVAQLSGDDLDGMAADLEDLDLADAFMSGLYDGGVE